MRHARGAGGGPSRKFGPTGCRGARRVLTYQTRWPMPRTRAIGRCGHGHPKRSSKDDPRPSRSRPDRSTFRAEARRWAKPRSSRGEAQPNMFPPLPRGLAPEFPFFAHSLSRLLHPSNLQGLRGAWWKKSEQGQWVKTRRSSCARRARSKHAWVPRRGSEVLDASLAERPAGTRHDTVEDGLPHAGDLVDDRALVGVGRGLRVASDEAAAGCR